MPFVEFYIDKFIGHCFKKHICGKADAGFLHTKACRDLKLRRGKDTYLFGERLLLQLFYFLRREGIAFAGERS